VSGAPATDADRASACVVDVYHDADLGRLLEIERASFGSPWSRTSFEREQELAFSQLLVARLAPGEAAAGYICRWLVADEIQILNVAVAPEVRRRGVARALVGRVIAEAKAVEIAVSLEVEISNEAAIALYGAFGFSAQGRRRNFYGLGRHALVMTLSCADA